ncbi:uncharacterized protein LOC107268298 [Cephus cinctus]|uniref:Uncharacterized protein LOC107268298 n=1 Tax=Cephus cinctus TaxID=211228 RepID=A0AAJ7FKK2_CEPCN|nr:uncharacterized protein LOC107268298 [Cephus cinctus]
MLDTVLKHMRALKALKRPTDQWDYVMIYLVTSRLDPLTSKEWETSIKKGEIPKFTELTDFLAQRCRALEASSRTQKGPSNPTKQGKSDQGKSTKVHVATTNVMCAFCEKHHPIYRCNEFVQLKVEQWIKEAKTPTTAGTHSKKAPTASVSLAAVRRKGQVLLATTVVNVVDSKGNPRPCRALLDCGSQSRFITTNCVEKLGLKQFGMHIPISGLEELSMQTRKLAKITIQSRVKGYQARLDCLVIEKITQFLPASQLDVEELQIPDGITLADPEFNQPSAVDLLIGAEIYFELLCNRKIKLAEDQPIWQKTVLGWIVSGKFAMKMPPRKDIKAQLGRSIHRNATNENKQLQNLPESRNTALQRFTMLERKLERRPQLKKEYSDFIHEYLKLGHMRELGNDSPSWDIRPHFYLPHHCVIKETTTTTRLRVVFDASSKTTSGISLNDSMFVGFVLQEDLFSILLRFRSFEYALTADIAKRYRQILVDETQVPLQRIVWRDQITDDIKTYELLTLTYETAPASFLATKWASNNRDLLEDATGSSTTCAILELNKDGTSKTLGVKWNPTKDVLQYAISIELLRTSSHTKRSILSDIHTEWSDYVMKIQALNGLTIPRKITVTGPDVRLELHGFCDASERAYGACVYMRSSLSIEFLQLCRAQLLTHLMSNVKKALEVVIISTYYWTDSSIVLHWIQARNKKLPVFVAHRIGEIQEMTSINE